MLSKSKIKFIHSLALRKNRTERRVFLAEGPKLVGDLLGKDKAMLLLATKEWLDRRHENGCLSEEIVEVDEDELSKASLQKHPQQVIAVFCQKKTRNHSPDVAWSVVLDARRSARPRKLGYDSQNSRLVRYRKCDMQSRDS